MEIVLAFSEQTHRGVTSYPTFVCFDLCSFHEQTNIGKEPYENFKKGLHGQNISQFIFKFPTHGFQISVAAELWQLQSNPPIQGLIF